MPLLERAPLSVRGSAFRAVCERLRTHPTTRSAIRTWKSWQGNADDEAPPTPANVPWVRLTPLALPAARKAEARGPRPATIYYTPIKVAVELVTAGPRIEDAMAMWERIESALWPSDPGERADWELELAGLGVRDLKLIQPALPAGLDSVASDLIVSDGSFQLDLYVTI